MKTVTIYTDGACSGNPGPGGWGAVLKYGAHERELSGGEASTTNNRMELTAVIEALRLLKEPCIVELYSDSRYVIDALEKRWAAARRQQADAALVHGVHIDSCEGRLESLKVLYDAGILDREEYLQRVSRVKRQHADSRG